MIGNDVVDLKQAALDSNWRRPRFLDKVFTAEEQQLIANALDQHQMVWLLWSMKEAAYKLYLQEFGKPFFNPKKLQCRLVSLSEGTVCVFENTYHIQTEFVEDGLHAIATLKVSTRTYAKLFLISSASHNVQSQNVREQLLKAVCEQECISVSKLKVLKSNLGIPYLSVDGSRLQQSISLSHHGRYGGFAIC